MRDKSGRILPGTFTKPSLETLRIIYPAGVQAFIADGKSYGYLTALFRVVFWYNKELCEKANVDPTRSNIGGLARCGPKVQSRSVISRLPLGRIENWPLQFYPRF